MKWRSVGIGAGVLLALASVVLGAALWWWTHSGRAQRSGEVALPGLTAKVEVRFDEWGVPSVSGASLEDVACALGWLHANDRIGQMELQRRAATGRLSELLGERTLAVDLKMRWLRFARTAERMWNALAPDHQRLLDAYARGVNAWLAAHEHDLPPDLLLLRAAPKPWSGRDSLCVQLMMAHMLSFSAAREQTRFRWLQELGEERTRDLLGDPALHIDQEVLELAKKPIKTSSLIDSPTAGEQNGSNGWAVSGARGADGHALVANDPHLQLGLPALWYQALLRAPDYEASGMTIPGLPIVVIGQGPHVAWGFTNTELDVCDVFFEKGEHGARDVERDGVQVPTISTVEPRASTLTMVLRSAAAALAEKRVGHSRNRTPHRFMQDSRKIRRRKGFPPAAMLKPNATTQRSAGQSERAWRYSAIFQLTRRMYSVIGPGEATAAGLDGFARTR